MAKLTKSDAISAVKNIARVEAEALNKPLAWIEATPYDARRAEARAILAARTQLQAIVDTSDKYWPDVEEAFVDETLAVWGRQERERNRLRKAFADACRGITAEQAAAKVVALVESLRLRGARVSTSSGVSVTVERAWGVSADLYVRFESDYTAVSNPDDETQRAYRYHVETKVTWSSTGRSLAEAQASVALYRELVDAMAEVEAVMSHERVVQTYGLPEPAAETV